MNDLGLKVWIEFKSFQALTNCEIEKLFFKIQLKFRFFFKKKLQVLKVEKLLGAFKFNQV